ncbi:hypothetical protein F2Q69_00014306 [Brassica cretica]|uniref:DUF1985 domain-containing protein n=1 Tax=Brassica cretica TaxID=69181 RepID=A0A8S9R0J3_BRACR|nr:hypothetical protein F2Q69_00014306 [Brassica cretica]
MRKPKTKKKVKISNEETPPQNEIGGTSLPDLRLPPRLFATDRFPTKRLNIYSSPDFLPFIRNVLRDTPELETICQSCFGKLFDLPARQCPMSCKLIHLFLTRQLVSFPKNTLRSAFGGSPFRYGHEEFGIVTGLPCGFFPERYKPNTDRQRHGWVEDDTDFSHYHFGVLIAHKQEARPTPRYVRMVENLKKKFAFLWGRESFLKTISCMKPPKFVRKKCEDPVATLVKKLKQHSFRLQGFPLSLQLLAFHGNLPQHNSINSIDICRVKFDPNLVVTPIIPIEIQAQPRWGLWPNDVKDDSVIYLEQFIADQHIPSTNKCGMVKQLRREMKRRKKRSHGRQSSFNTLFSRRKQSNTPSHSPEPTPTHTDDLHNQDDSPMETDELPQTRSPIISQYEAQLHRDSTADHLASYPVSDPCIHTQSVHVSPNHNNTSVHTSPNHNIDSVQVSPVYLGTIHHTPPVSQMITHTNDATDDYNEPPRTPVSVQPPWSELNSVVYNKSDHPNSPEIHHILYHGVRIYDAINPDPPIFDSSIPPGSLPRSRLLLSPQPTTMLTSPIKSNDSLSGFTVHAATVNAFTATASSNSPPSLSLKEQNTDGVVDLTATKNMESHVPSLEENHLAHELSKSPLITALALISPLPDLEWDLFYSTISTMTKVGSKLTTFGAQTKESLCRRFHRCKIGVKRQSEHHLFKWIDEEIIDEISKVDSKLSQLQVDVQSFKRTTTQRLQKHGKNIDESLLEMKRIIHDQTIMLAELRNNSTLVVDASYASLTNGSFVTKSTSPFLNIAVAAIALGTMA